MVLLRPICRFLNAVRSVAAGPQGGGTAAPGRMTVPQTTIFCDSTLLSQHQLLTAARVRHIRFPLPGRPASADNGYWAKLLENHANIALSGQNALLING
jgi:hypothetical protein